MEKPPFRCGLLALEISVCPTDSQTSQAITIAFGHPSELDGKIQLKIPHIDSQEMKKKIRLVSAWRLHPYWVLFIVLGGSRHHARRKAIISLTQMRTVRAIVTAVLARHAYW